MRSGEPARGGSAPRPSTVKLLSGPASHMSRPSGPKSMRGTTSREIINMAREAGATQVFLASAAPPVRFPNVYGIDMPTREELIAGYRSIDEVGAEIGADALIYQDLEDLKKTVGSLNPAIEQFECSCFDGIYVTGDVTPEYLDSVEGNRGAARKQSEEDEQLDVPTVGAMNLRGLLRYEAEVMAMYHALQASPS
jgi:amidophosphoribosyltransferase